MEPLRAAALKENAKEIRKLLRYEDDKKNLGEEGAKIMYSLSDAIDEMPKAWCGNWMRRACHNGGRFGGKCSDYNEYGCGGYMCEIYDEDPNGKAKWDEWFANDPECDFLVQCYDPSVSKVTRIEKRKGWWHR